MPKLLRSWDEARTETLCDTAMPANVGQMPTSSWRCSWARWTPFVVQVDDRKLSCTAGRLSSKDMGAMSDHAILA